MRKTANSRLSILAIVAIAAALVAVPTLSVAKPDKVDGINVPSGRIPQKIKDNRYPRTYFPGTEKLANE